MSRKVFVMMGGHASGKTTVCKLFQEVLGNTCVILGDLDNRFKGTVEFKQANLREFLANEERDIIFEGMRAPLGLLELFMELCPDLTFVLALMSGKRMLANIKHRCQKAGKEFSAKQQEYWTQSKLDYESHKRFLNLLAKMSRENPEGVRKVTLRVIRHSDTPLDFSAWEPEIQYILSQLMRLK
jgi:hypothetical protein